MRIVSLQAENLKRLIAVDIRPGSNVVQITGKNGAGKTSVLDAIWWALAGKRNIQAVPIRKGAERALIKLDLGEYRVTRTFNAQDDGDFTTGLTVESAEGARFSKAQDVLTSFLGELTFDPIAFTRKAPEEQFDTLKAFVQGIDFGQVAADDKQDYDDRTVANRRAKDLRAQADGVTLPAGPVPQRVDVAALEGKLAEAATQNADVATRKAARDRAEERINAIGNEIERLVIERDGLKERLATAGPLPEPIDVEQTRQDLAKARETNAVVERAEQKAVLVDQARKFEEEAAALTKRIEAREADKQDAIAKAKMPIQGLGFGGVGGQVVTLDGLPFDQASTSRQIRAGCAIAAALNPKLRICFIHDGSLLDDDAMAWLETWAEEQDMQVWVERVDPAGAVGFAIEDGRVRGAAEPLAPASGEELEEGV